MADEIPSIDRKARILILIVAYHAESTIEKVLKRIPLSLSLYDTEVLIIDDCSKDSTFEIAESIRRDNKIPFRLTVLCNPVNQGYGGNQKIGFHYAIENNFDFVALVHGDGQYAPECLPDLLKPLLEGKADAVFGSRMIRPFDALKGGMPFYKFIGNKLLTAYQNWILGTNLSEFHSGYRLYSTKLLNILPFELNTNHFYFDTEIIIQAVLSRSNIVEIPIPVYYGDEICRVNGLKYAFDVIKASTIARLQRFNLIYRSNYDVTILNSAYTSKLEYSSSHSEAVLKIRPFQTVLDLGCGPGHLLKPLKEIGCRVIGADLIVPDNYRDFDEFYKHDLNSSSFIDRKLDDVNVILLLDIIEHLYCPEKFCALLGDILSDHRNIQIIISTGNVGFFVIRLMLLLGFFNYGKKGILDLTHTRLFTFASVKRLFEMYGFRIIYHCGIPAPFGVAIRNKKIAYILTVFNRMFIHLSKTLFSYQIFMIAKPTPKLRTLLKSAFKESTIRSQSYRPSTGLANKDDRHLK